MRPFSAVGNRALHATLRRAGTAPPSGGVTGVGVSGRLGSEDRGRGPAYAYDLVAGHLRKCAVDTLSEFRRGAAKPIPQCTAECGARIVVLWAAGSQGSAAALLSMVVFWFAWSDYFPGADPYDPGPVTG